MILNFAKLLVITLCCILPFCLAAQKLPNIQTTSVLLPETVKVDGKLNEWPKGLIANNKANHLQYTLANNDKNLYLAVQTTDKATIGKIIAGGINITIGLAGDKSKNKSSITYPLNSLKYGRNAGSYLDSVKIKEMVGEAREIKVLNIKSVPDSLISIYNTYNIKSIIKYNDGKLIYELMLPLDFLGITGGVNSKFNYIIKLIGLIRPPANNGGNVPPPPAGLAPDRSPSSTIGLIYEMEEATDFSGTYTLYKK